MESSNGMAIVGLLEFHLVAIFRNASIVKQDSSVAEVMMFILDFVKLADGDRSVGLMKGAHIAFFLVRWRFCDRCDLDLDLPDLNNIFLFRIARLRELIIIGSILE